MARFVAPLNHPAAYDVWPAQPARETSLSWPDQQRYLRLPRYGNPAARELAQRLAERYPDPGQRVTALLSLFREGKYRYTLKPPVLQGAHRIDAFLFSTLSGFCEHFAGATAFVLRASGIPARVVAGYQGGAWNEDGQFLVIRQYDAHAWVEAWLPDKGWTRLDPTAWVAPERVELGLREAVAEEGSFLEEAPLSLSRYAHVPLWAWLGNRMEEINFQWYKWVVQFDSRRQSALLQRLFGQGGLRTALWALIGGLATLLALIAVWMLWRPRRTGGGAVSELGAWLRQRLGKKGLPVTPDMPIGALIGVCKRSWPEASAELERWSQSAERILYAAALPEADLQRELRRLKHQFRRIRLHGRPRLTRNQEQTA
ncbi:MAG: transglutaminase family protein [Gammaproteobacteria bacterium]|nr:MAG: transglutaminase family protein [Gammaproteobacteria bacterium]